MRTRSVTRQSIVTLDTGKLAELRAQLKAYRGSYVKVGILGDDNRPKVPGKLSGPDLGAVHELGSASSTPPIPRRSFLKVPLIDQLPQAIQQRGPAYWRRAILEKGVLWSLQALGVEGENVVQQGFATGGFGKWQPLAPYTIKKKGAAAILIEKGFMRKAVHSAVVKGRP